jgi:hypothetical protein
MRPLSSPLLALPLVLLALTAKADPDVEVYEAAYLASCTVDLGRSDCHCRMNVIEAALSQRLFAQLVARYGGDIRKVLPDEAVAAQVKQRCGAVGPARSGRTQAAAN